MCSSPASALNSSMRRLHVVPGDPLALRDAREINIVDHCLVRLDDPVRQRDPEVALGPQDREPQPALHPDLLLRRPEVDEVGGRIAAGEGRSGCSPRGFFHGGPGGLRARRQTVPQVTHVPAGQHPDHREPDQRGGADQRRLDADGLGDRSGADLTDGIATKDPTMSYE
jgi:hypothetical protein